MALPDKFIVFLGRTFSGHNHDYLMLKQEFPPELDWFIDINVRVDLGYLGMQSDYKGDRIDIPTKKPRKSKDCQYSLESSPHLYRACHWRYEALQHFGPYLSQSHKEF